MLASTRLVAVRELVFEHVIKPLIWSVGKSRAVETAMLGDGSGSYQLVVAINCDAHAAHLSSVTSCRHRHKRTKTVARRTAQHRQEAATGTNRQQHQGLHAPGHALTDLVEHLCDLEGRALGGDDREVHNVACKE